MSSETIPSETASNEETLQAPLRPDSVRAVRIGHGANCSSVGSVVDTLFLGAAVGGAIFAAICAAMQSEPIRVVGEPEEPAPSEEEET